MDEAISTLLSDQEVEKITADSIWMEEFLDLKIAIGIADDFEDAITKINRYSGGHSVAIITTNKEAQTRFVSEIDAAAVYVNASTRFTDGGEFGLGAELGISTEKLHHRGPLGLDQLVSNKWVCIGNGQIRV